MGKHCLTWHQGSGKKCQDTKVQETIVRGKIEIHTQERHLG